MRRIRFDVPRWHVYLHREARGIDSVEKDDPAERQLEDELFDRLYAGGSEPLPEADRNQHLAEWSEKLHTICGQLPAFERLSDECRGDPDAAGAAVETLMDELRPHMEIGPEKAEEPVLRKAVNTGCDRSSEVIAERRETAEALGQVAFGKMGGGKQWGSGTGMTGAAMAASPRELMQRIQHDDRLRRIAMLAGKFKRIALQKQRAKVKHGSDEIADVETGGELGRLLPAELVKLAHPRLRLAFLRDLAERQCLQYRLTGTDTLGKGPLVVCLDKSGSMAGAADIWATAVALALLDVAQRQRRPFALLGFNAAIKHEVIVQPGDALPEQALFVSASGGTDIGLVLRHGLQIVREHPGKLKKADIVLITDGASETDTAHHIRTTAAELAVTILGVGIGVGKDDLAPWCDQTQEIRTLDDVDENTADTVFGV